MKLKIKLYKVKHLPDRPDEFYSWTFDIFKKKRIVHNGFDSGPFFKTKKEAKELFDNAFWANIWLMTDEL